MSDLKEFAEKISKHVSYWSRKKLRNSYASPETINNQPKVTVEILENLFSNVLSNHPMWTKETLEDIEYLYNALENYLEWTEDDKL